MSAAIELPPGDIEHIHLMYRELGVVLPKGHRGEGLPAACASGCSDHVTHKLEEVYPLIVRGRATEEMRLNFVQDVAIVNASRHLLLT